MIEEERNNFEQFDSIQLPPRSRFYKLVPEGIGNDIESLTSYVTRLCEHHSIRVGDLLTYISGNYFPNNTILGSNVSVFFKNASAVNNNQKSAEMFVEILESLTSYTGLKQLTFLQFNNLINQGEIRKGISLCPMCIHEIKIAGLEVYEKLVWNFKCVDMCEYHECKLINECFYCHSLLLPFYANSRVGYCPKCNQWLGKERVNKYISLEDLAWNRFVNNNIKMLFLYDNLGELKNNTFNNIESIIKMLCEVYLTKKEVYKRMDVYLGEWNKMKTYPSLKSILKICYCLNINITDLFFNSNLKVNTNLRELPNLYAINKSIYNRKRKKKNSIWTEEILLNTLNEDPPISFSELCRRLGYSEKNHSLKKIYPQLCEQIIFKYKQFKKEEAKRRQEMIKDEIYKGIKDLISIGNYPSKNSVENLIGKKALFRTKLYLNYYYEILEEFNITYKGKRKVQQ